jgi:hypothetical protein
MRGHSEAVADYLSSAQDILLIVLSPVFDLFIDIYGHRFHFVVLAPILWIIAYSLLGFGQVPPVVCLVFSSLANMINAISLQICIPLLVAGQSKLGTALVCGEHSTILAPPLLTLRLVFCKTVRRLHPLASYHRADFMPTDTEEGGYHKVLKLAMGIKAVALALGVTYIIIYYCKLGKGITMTKK